MSATHLVGTQTPKCTMNHQLIDGFYRYFFIEIFCIRIMSIQCFLFCMIFQLYSNASIYAVANGTEYPFGTHQWEVHNEPCYPKQPIKTLDLNINSCNRSEFNCHDGTCVHIDHRCNGRVECPDKTDEIDCQILSVDKSYLRTVPPPPPENRERSSVSIGVNILSILDIVEVENIFTLQFDLTITWYDERLTMTDLHWDTDLNTLSVDYLDQIWLPQVI